MALMISPALRGVVAFVAGPAGSCWLLGKALPEVQALWATRGLASAAAVVLGTIGISEPAVWHHQIRDSKQGQTPFTMFATGSMLGMFLFEMVHTLRRPVMRSGPAIWGHHIVFTVLMASSILTRRFQPFCATGGASEAIVVSTAFTSLCRVRPAWAPMLPLAKKLAVCVMMLRLGLDVFWFRAWAAMDHRGDPSERRAQTMVFFAWLTVASLDVIWTKQTIASVVRSGI